MADPLRCSIAAVLGSAHDPHLWVWAPAGSPRAWLIVDVDGPGVRRCDGQANPDPVEASRAD